MVEEPRWMPFLDASSGKNSPRTTRLRRPATRPRPYVVVTTQQAQSHLASVPTTTDEIEELVASIEDQLARLKALIRQRNASPGTVSALEPVAVTMGDAAKMLGISRATLFRMADRGEVERVVIGGIRRVPVAWIREYTASQKEAS